MQVRFVGGPLHGQTKEVAAERLQQDQPIYWPPSATRDVHEDAIPGEDDVAEYLYRGNGSADYVGGLIDET